MRSDLKPIWSDLPTAAAIGLALMFCATQIYFIEQIDCLQRLQNLKLI